MNKELLEEIGLTKSEINVYLALLELGSSSTGKIVDKSKASSSKIYEILDRLMQKGLVSFIVKSGVKYFEAAPPERIMDYMREKEEKFNQQKQELKHIIPELELKRKLSKYKSEATIFKGIEGAKTVYDDILKTLKKGDEYYLMGAHKVTQPFFDFIRHYHRQRVKKGIKIKILYSEAGKEWAKAIKDLPLTQIKFAPSQLLSSSFVLMYADKTLLIVATKTDLTFFRIENKEVTDSFKSQFELLWDQKVRTYEGQEAAFNDILETLKKGEEMVVIGFTDTPQWFQDFLVGFHKKRSEAGIIMRGINGENLRDMAEKLNKLPHSECRLLPAQKENPVAILVYKDKTLFSLPRDKVWMQVQNQRLADSFRVRFEDLWEQDTTVSKGLDALYRILEDYLHGLEPGETYNVLGATFGVEDTFFNREQYKQVFKKIHEERAKKGIKARLLFQQRSVEVIEKFRKSVYGKDHEAKILPYKTDFPVVILTSKKKTVITIQKEEPMTISINNEEASRAFQKHFDALWEQETQTLRGFEGTKHLAEDVLATGEDLYLIGATGSFEDLYPNYYKEWTDRRVKKELKIRLLADQEMKQKKFFMEMPMAERSFLPKEYSSPNVIWVYGNKVANVLWVEEPIVFIIENKQLADHYRTYFDMLKKVAT